MRQMRKVLIATPEPPVGETNKVTLNLNDSVQAVLDDIDDVLSRCGEQYDP
jgi:hypothetical protein